MELQNYIRNNNDYIRCMRNKNIKVIKDKTLNVALLTDKAFDRYFSSVVALELAAWRVL